MWYDSEFFSASFPQRQARIEEADASAKSPVLVRLTTAILHSFAEYGAAMYPSFFELGEFQAGGFEMRTPHARGVRPYLEDVSRDLDVDEEVEPLATARGASGWWGLWPLGRLWTALRQAQRRRQTRQQLEALDDRTLRDIGVSPDAIDYVVTHENFY